ncbi:FecR family protein [Niabella aquatica]
MSKSRLIELLAKRASREITLLEQQELTMLINNNESYALLARSFDVLDTARIDVAKIDEKDFESRWSSLQAKLPEDGLSLKNGYKHPRKSFRLLWYRLAAACIVLVVIIGILFFRHQNSMRLPGEDNIVATQRGSKSYTVLPDGTQVWLNADTKISYGKSFGTGTRDVTLTGEAYFDVVKDASKPFVVHTEAMDIIVLGTAFNVSAYKSEMHTEATLIRGAVEVSLKKYHDKRVMLKPFEKLSVKNTPDVVTKKEQKQQQETAMFTLSKINKIALDSGSAETQWVQNRLVFTNSTLEDIAIRLARWYDVDITITSQALKQTKYSAEFDNATLEEVMQSLKLAGRFSYNIDNKKITISQ